MSHHAACLVGLAVEKFSDQGDMIEAGLGNRAHDGHDLAVINRLVAAYEDPGVRVVFGDGGQGLQCGGVSIDAEWCRVDR